jgi:hypothetical protein
MRARARKRRDCAAVLKRYLDRAGIRALARGGTGAAGGSRRNFIAPARGRGFALVTWQFNSRI